MEYALNRAAMRLGSGEPRKGAHRRRFSLPGQRAAMRLGSGEPRKGLAVLVLLDPPRRAAMRLGSGEPRKDVAFAKTGPDTGYLLEPQ